MPRLPNRAQSATVVKPSRLDAAMRIAKRIPMSDEHARHSVRCAVRDARVADL